MPTRQILPACCARSGSGNAVVAIALAIADMNSRLAMPLAIRPARNQTKNIMPNRQVRDQFHGGPLAAFAASACGRK
jgi:hypothetical protein